MSAMELSNLPSCSFALATHSSLSGADALMCFLLQNRDDLVETPDIDGLNATNHRAFQCG